MFTDCSALCRNSLMIFARSSQIRFIWSDAFLSPSFLTALMLIPPITIMKSRMENRAKDVTLNPRECMRFTNPDHSSRMDTS